MDYNAVNLQEKFSKFNEHWSPKIIAEMNNYHFKLAKIEGDFTWHSHPDTDEFFLVIKGTMKIIFRDGEVELNAGEAFVVPKGVEHKTYAENECKIMFVDPAGTQNTGDAGGEQTAEDNVWI